MTCLGIGATEVGHEYMSLEKLVAQSQYIFVVQKVHPYETIEKVTIGGGYPPFTKPIYHFKVLEVLKKQADYKNFTGKILVLESSSEWKFEIHRDYYVKKLRKSPIFAAYRSMHDQESSNKMIIFVNKKDDQHFEFTVENAYESPEKKTELKKLIGPAEKEDKSIGIEK